MTDMLNQMPMPMTNGPIPSAATSQMPWTGSNALEQMQQTPQGRARLMALIQQLMGGGNGAGQWAPGMPAPGMSAQRPNQFGGGLSQLGNQMMQRMGSGMPPTEQGIR